MQATITYDTGLRRLLQPLLAVRHAHLRPLLAISANAHSLSLHYGRPDACQSPCDGVRGALRAIHAAGLWVGDVLAGVGLDEVGRVVLSGVGSGWDLTDPFAGHPAAVRYDLRIGWRQRGDILQLEDISGALTRCG